MTDQEEGEVLHPSTAQESSSAARRQSSGVRLPPIASVLADEQGATIQPLQSYGLDPRGQHYSGERSPLSLEHRPPSSPRSLQPTAGSSSGRLDDLASYENEQRILDQRQQRQRQLEEFNMQDVSLQETAHHAHGSDSPYEHRTQGLSRAQADMYAQRPASPLWASQQSHPHSQAPYHLPLSPSAGMPRYHRQQSPPDETIDPLFDATGTQAWTARQMPMYSQGSFAAPQVSYTASPVPQSALIPTGPLPSPNHASHGQQQQNAGPAHYQEAHQLMQQRQSLQASTSAHPGPPPPTRELSLEEMYKVDEYPDGRMYICLIDRCSERFVTQENVEDHIKSQHLEKRPHVCAEDGCFSSFVRSHDLRRHSRIHTKVRPFTCSCGKAFSRGDALNRHRRRNICIGGVGPSTTLQTPLAQQQQQSLQVQPQPPPPPPHHQQHQHHQQQQQQHHESHHSLTQQSHPLHAATPPEQQ
ncbi:uncharacterized protein L969DRAFT_97107 [Mixia osmundae IAM 14324]|uniref:C2H2-type domain-containing protein n=1 Tax=Mixia osmundae (strain CBS 9802 / IAM 14324 / JCM 22182 / KY 12970) TaxID=764103 RepID=G7E1P8_MIXOS|nr:uncharacterized protein L969DRAFT_97107 [Mixia osmundae IAM 14324]KEI36708.1 hypothetical protein L969DRAFT_97107 [Mixia osmundae IAM 14324]GAA96758.1 hypothetical protein E5Q_03429 [Mixia osmundae IAM 14324]